MEPYADLLPEIDMLLLMTVEPGYGGQHFLDLVLPKLRRARSLVAARGAEIWLQVDGGVHEETIERCAEAGADVFVAGSRSTAPTTPPAPCRPSAPRPSAPPRTPPGPPGTASAFYANGPGCTVRARRCVPGPRGLRLGAAHEVLAADEEQRAHRADQRDGSGHVQQVVRPAANGP